MDFPVQVKIALAVLRQQEWSCSPLGVSTAWAYNWVTWTSPCMHLLKIRLIQYCTIDIYFITQNLTKAYSVGGLNLNWTCFDMIHMNRVMNIWTLKLTRERLNRGYVWHKRIPTLYNNYVAVVLSSLRVGYSLHCETAAQLKSLWSPCNTTALCPSGGMQP